MNKLSTYIPSLIVSILLVLTILFSTGALLVTTSINNKKAYELVKEKNLGEVVQLELQSYYYNRYNSTGIPSDVYTLNVDYIFQCEKECIDRGFYALEYSENPDINVPANTKLEEKILRFFTQYANDEGYELDDNFKKKVDETTSNAYASIKNHCDVFKISALAEHKVLLRISRLYKYRSFFAIFAFAADVILILMLLFINRKKKSVTLYWTGISALIAGLAGSIPCAVLLINKYYDSFSIKQPAVFIAYTGMMYKLTRTFMTMSVIIAVIAVILLVIYGLTCNKKTESKKEE